MLWTLERQGWLQVTAEVIAILHQTLGEEAFERLRTAPELPVQLANALAVPLL